MAVIAQTASLFGLVDRRADFNNDGHPDVLEHPEPECLFLGFGDSSLDFQVRAWAATEKSFQVQSDLRFAIRKALTDAGIEIPFPQRDLHLRTVQDDSPLATLDANAGAGLPEGARIRRGRATRGEAPAPPDPGGEAPPE